MEAHDRLVEFLVAMSPSVPREYPVGEAGEFLRSPDKQALSLLLGAMAMYGSDSPWRFPFDLSRRLGVSGFNAAALAAVGEAEVRRAVGTKPALHIDPPRMGRWIQQAGQVLVGQYGGSANWIWNDYRRIEVERLVRRLMEIPGMGPVKALMLSFILRKDWDAEIVGWGEFNPPMDTGMSDTLRRLGIGRLPLSDDPELIVKVYEGLRSIAKAFCAQGRPLCDACPLSAKCPKQGV